MAVFLTNHLFLLQGVIKFLTEVVSLAKVHAEIRLTEKKIILEVLTLSSRICCNKK